MGMNVGTDLAQVCHGCCSFVATGVLFHWEYCHAGICVLFLMYLEIVVISWSVYVYAK